MNCYYSQEFSFPFLNILNYRLLKCALWRDSVPKVSSRTRVIGLPMLFLRLLGGKAMEKTMILSICKLLPNASHSVLETLFFHLNSIKHFPYDVPQFLLLNFHRIISTFTASESEKSPCLIHTTGQPPSPSASITLRCFKIIPNFCFNLDKRFLFNPQ